MSNTVVGGYSMWRSDYDGRGTYFVNVRPLSQINKLCDFETIMEGK